MVDAIRMGVVGLGWVGQARHLPAICNDDRFELVGVADRREGRPQEVASRYSQLRSTTAARLSDIDWIDELEAVSIATAPMAHHDLVCEALSRGLHVITEKPFAMTPDEGRQMLAASVTSSRSLAVVHNFQFARSMLRLKADIAVGALGKISCVRAVQLGNPRRRLPLWYDDLPLGLFYDESPHLLYLLSAVSGRLTLSKAISVESRSGMATPAQIDCWFTAEGADYPITMSCNFESGLSEWYLIVHGDLGVGIVDIFRDIYIYAPNDGAHGTWNVLKTSCLVTIQHWWQHIASGIPHLRGTLRYGNDHVFARFGQGVRGDGDAIAPIRGEVALNILLLQHDIIEQRERLHG